MNTSKIILVVCSALILVSCRTTTVNLEERFRKGELTVSEYLRLRDQRKTEESVPQTNYGSNAGVAVLQAVAASSQAYNLEAQQRLKEQQHQTRQIISNIGEKQSQVYQNLGQQMAQINNPINSSLPTTAQISTPGVWTGNIKYASDMTPYREYRRPDGSTYWSRTPDSR